MRMNDLYMDVLYLVEIGVFTKEQVENIEIDELKDLVNNHQV